MLRYGAMRFQFRRLNKCRLFIVVLSILLLLFTSESLFKTSTNPARNAESSIPPPLGDQPGIHHALPNQLEENELKEVRKGNPLHENVQKSLVEVVEQPEPDFPMPHPENVANAVEVVKKGADSNQSEMIEMYDWTTIKDQFFRGDKVPDNMLAVTRPRYLKDYKNPCFYLLHPRGDTVVRGDVRAGLKCLPYFQLIGVDKSGTTDLWARLMQHPQVVQNSGVLGKETHWWSWRRFGFDIWVRNAPIRHFDWYLSHFDEAAKKIRDHPVTDKDNNVTFHPWVTGEGSPTVFWDFTGWDLMPQNAGRKPENALVTPFCIRHLTPDVKLILMLRNPVERLYSEYLFLDRFKGGQHNISAELFHEGVLQSIAMYSDCLKQHSFQACVYNKTLHMIIPIRIVVGMYHLWLELWYAAYPKDQILIFRNEDYSHNLASHMAQLFAFLGLSQLKEAEMQQVVVRRRAFQRSESEKAVGDMLPATRKILTDFYQPFNKKLADMLHDPKYLWQ